MALRVDTYSLNGSGTFTGHTFRHSPHEVQSSVTKRAFWRTLTLKLPTKPSTDSISHIVIRWRLSRRSADDHLRGEDACGAVESGEGLVELRHHAADGRLSLDQVDIVAGFGDVERGLDPCDPAANDEGRRIHVGIHRVERFVEGHPADRTAHQRLLLWSWRLPDRCAPRRIARGCWRSAPDTG